MTPEEIENRAPQCLRRCTRCAPSTSGAQRACRSPCSSTPAKAPSLPAYVNRHRREPVPPDYAVEFLADDWTLAAP